MSVISGISTLIGMINQSKSLKARTCLIFSILILRIVHIAYAVALSMKKSLMTSRLAVTIVQYMYALFHLIIFTAM